MTTDDLLEFQQYSKALTATGSDETSSEIIVKFLESLQTAILHRDAIQIQRDKFLLDIKETLYHNECKQRFLSSLNDHSDPIIVAYIQTISRLIQHASLPPQRGSDDHVYPEDNFTVAREATRVCAPIINFLLTHLWDILKSKYSSEELSASNVRKKLVKGCVPPCVVMWASHRDSHPWTDLHCRQATHDLAETLCNISYASVIQSILCDNDDGDRPGCNSDTPMSRYFVDVMNLLKPSLTRDTWKQEPCSRQVLYCCLLNVKHPHLGQHLELVLPPALLFVDDYKVENKILGMRCLHHIIQNVDPTELSWYSRSHVIYDALQHHLYNQDPSVLSVLYPCLLAILGVIEKSPHKASEIRKLNRYDTVFQTILSNMEHKQKLVLRSVHASCLAEFINKMSIIVLRHMKRLLRVLTSYLEVYDGAEQTARLYILSAMKALIVQAWPRIPSHYDVIVKSLVKLLYDVTACDDQDISQQVQSDIVSGVEECLLLLKKCCGSQVDNTLQSLHGCEASNQVMDKCFQRVLSDICVKVPSGERS